MRIFVSHSSRQKLLVKELRRQLPHNVNLWIDEHEIVIGEEVESTIRNAIEHKCDFMILILDTFAAKSAWVRKEVNWALARENELGRPVLLPIVIDKEALDELGEASISSRRYLTCSSLTDEAIASLARSLSSELFEWLSRELEHRSHGTGPSALGTLRKAEEVTTQLANAVKSIVHPFRRDNPLKVSVLLEKLNARQITDPFTTRDIVELIESLQRNHLLSGVRHDNDIIYLAQERYSLKSSLHRDSKHKISRTAAALVKPGDTVALDGGTTILELAHHLGQRLRSQDLSDLSVVTNSIPAANALLSVLSDLGTGDANSLCAVYVAGGLARPVSLTLISDTNYVRAAKTAKQKASLEKGAGLRGLLEMLGGADVAFVGTNGIYRREGFAVNHKHEVTGKRLMIDHARRRVVLADASKLSIQQIEPFAYFKEGFTVISTHDTEYANAIDEFSRLIEGTSSELILA